MAKKRMMKTLVRRWAVWALEKTFMLVALLSWAVLLALLVGWTTS